MSEADTFPMRCLVEDCDRGPFDDKKALMGHVNGSAAPGHDWSEVKDRLEGTDSGTDEGGKAGDSSGDGETHESSDEEATEGAPEGAVTDSDDDMPTQEEYENQHDGDSSGGKSGDSSTDDDQPNRGGTTSRSAPIGLPMDPKTLGMLLAVALVLWVSYRALSGSDDGTSNDPALETSDEGDKTGDNSSDPEVVSGGLVEA